MSEKSRQRFYKVLGGIGVTICLVAAYLIWTEQTVLNNRNAHYEYVIEAHRQKQFSKVMENAKQFFAKRPRRPNDLREAQVLDFYEDALRHWIALHAIEADATLNAEIETFQGIASRLAEDGS